MIISGGVNVYPQETEDTLLNHPAVLDAAVIGIPHEDFGEAVHAVVQLLPNVDASDELRDILFIFFPNKAVFDQMPPKYRVSGNVAASGDRKIA